MLFKKYIYIYKNFIKRKAMNAKVEIVRTVIWGFSVYPVHVSKASRIPVPLNKIFIVN